MDEYQELRKRFNNIVFGGYDGSSPDKNKYYFLIECYSILPHTYDIEYLKKFKGIITWSSLFQRKYSGQLNIIKINGFPMFNRQYKLSSFKKYSERIKGVALICRHRIENIEGNIAGFRLDIMKNLHKINQIETHCYGKASYGDDMYRGQIGTSVEETFPSSYQKLLLLNDYVFNLCLENCYHETWSWDYITEKIFDAFRSKTIAIYYGAYNIKNIIPPDLYIDYRNFKSDNELSDYLKNFTEQQYIDMTEKAYQFDLNCRLGNIEDLEKILKELK